MEHEARYLLEWWTESYPLNKPWGETFEATLKKSFLLPQVSGYVRVAVPATARTWTFGRRPVKEHAGVRQEQISIQGESGFKIRLASDRTGNEVAMSGKKSFDELAAFLREYEAEAAKTRSATVRAPQSPTLVLRAIWEGDAYIVDNITLTPHHTVTGGKFIWRYELTCLTEARLSDDDLRKSDAPKADPQAWEAMSRGRDNEEKNRARDALSLSSPDTRVSRAAGDLSRLERPASEASPLTYWGADKALSKFDNFPRELAPAKIYVDRLRTALDLADAVAKRTGSVMGLPHAVAADVMQVAADTVRQIRSIFERLTVEVKQRIEKDKRRIEASIQAIEINARMIYGAMGGGDLAPRDASGSSSMTIDRRYPTETARRESAVVLAVHNADSFYEAHRRSGTTLPELLAWNGAAAAHEAADGSPIAPGDTFISPNPSGTPLVHGSALDPYFTDFRWDVDRQDFVTSGTEPDDFDFIQGVDNLKQAFRVRGKTVHNQVAPYPAFGLPRLIGERSTQATAGFVASHFNSSFRRDVRVSDIRDIVVVSKSGDDYEVRGRVKTVHQGDEIVGATLSGGA